MAVFRTFLACLVLSCALSAAAQDRVVPVEHVRYDYAQVLRAEPVQQTLRAKPACVKGERCEEREYKRVIGYDVTYSYQGGTYRSRLARDPGRRLRIRVGITPQMDNRVKP